jgi:hypothetical protein
MEYLVLAAMLVTLAVVVEMRFRVAAIIREVRSEARTTHGHLTESIQRLDMLETALVTSLKESLEGHPVQARAPLQVSAASSRRTRLIAVTRARSPC